MGVGRSTLRGWTVADLTGHRSETGKGIMMKEGLTLITTLLHSPRVLGRQWVGDTLKPLGWPFWEELRDTKDMGV